MKKISCLCLTLLIVASTVFAGGQREARSFPSRPITCIIPYAPGGGSDTLVRTVMRFITMPNDQPWVAINVEGAGGFTGAMRAFNSAPDGYTIFTHNTMDLVSYYQSGQDTIPILTQATTIALIVTDYKVISTNRIAAAEHGWRTIEDVVAWVRANPGSRIRWGVAGSVQGDNMISSIRIARALGIYDNINFVAYDSGATVRTASLQNEVQISLNTVSEIPGVVASGDNIPLLVANYERIRLLPNTPTTAERGINVTMTKPRGFFGPRGMNPENVRIIENALREVSNNPEFRRAMEDFGFDVVFLDSTAATELAINWMAELQPYFEEFRRQN